MEALDTNWAQKSLATTIRDLRLKKGMTLKEVAEKVHLNDGYISLLETGKRPLSSSNFAKIMNQALGIDVFTARKIWQEHFSNNLHSNESVSSRSIVSTKYKVICRGIEDIYDDRGNDRSSRITFRWVIQGKLYVWMIYTTSSYLQEKDILSGTLGEANWKQIIDLLHKQETILLLEAMLDELSKEDGSSDPLHAAVLEHAQSEIEDLRDVVESYQPKNKTAAEIRLEDLPF